MRVIITSRAESDFLGILKHLHDVNPAAAVSAEAALSSAVSVLRKNPLAGRVIEEDVRCFVVSPTPYAIYYKVMPDHIAIILIFHQKQNRPH